MDLVATPDEARNPRRVSVGQVTNGVRNKPFHQGAACFRFWRAYHCDPTFFQHGKRDAGDTHSENR